jgi:hypothetical protein
MVVATKGRIACVHLEFGDRKEKEVDQKIVDWRDDQNKSEDFLQLQPKCSHHQLATS